MAAPVSSAAPPPKKDGKKIAGLSPTTLLIIMGVGLVGGAWFLLRRNKQAAAATDTGGGSAQGTADSEGNDFAGQIATLQTEIADLQGALSDDDGGSGGGDAGGSHRQVADGSKSLNQVASERHTSAAHIIAVTRASTEISKANLARFNKYVAGGTGKRMPVGLVFYTTHAGSEPGAENEGGGGDGDGDGSGTSSGGGGGGVVDPGGPMKPGPVKPTKPNPGGPVKPNPGGTIRKKAPHPATGPGERMHPGTAAVRQPPRRAAAHHTKKK